MRREDLSIEHIRGSGPGGQHRNKRFTGIRLTHRPSGLVAVATERRSQAQNLALAWQRLEEKLRVSTRRPKPRRPTSATRASQERRLKQKAQVAGKKRQRGRISDED